MTDRSPFDEEWRESLAEQFKHAARLEGKTRRDALRQMLHELGFSEGQLRDLYIDATMHIDDLNADFLPDLDMIEHRRHRLEKNHPLECACPTCRS